MRTRTLLASTGLLALGIVAGASAAIAGENNPRNDPHIETEKVMICHATASEKNPFTVNEISFNAVDNGYNIDWNGHGDHEGDIIPAFADFPGLNWTELGQAIWNNGCEVPTTEPEPQETTVPEETETPEPEETTTPEETPEPEETTETETEVEVESATTTTEDTEEEAAPEAESATAVLSDAGFTG
ncbi:hypothetical protein [Demequina rhizosphaerae]|uniref:hypothetical protein n=1 Tax=Demequina rhizosphaerae TaxID=1638985 RepID=UPI0007863EF4|nr:hypothetical protein [Demequina rhizosphaerae]